MYSPEVQSRITQLRNLAMTNEITRDQMKEAVRLLREGRLAAQQASASAGKRSKAAKAPVNTQALFDELDKM